MAYTVTATKGGGGSSGMQLYVIVLDNAAMAITPATGTSLTAYNCSVTTSQANSVVCGALMNSGSNGTLAAESGTNLTQYNDTTNFEQDAGFYTNVIASAGPTTVGSSTTFNSGYGCCGVEILASGGTITVDGSSPAAVTTTGTGNLTTASFTPPGGSLLVATVATGGGFGGVITMGFSSTPSLTWTVQVSESAQGGGTEYAYVGVATAVVPAPPAVGPALNQGLLPNRPAVIVSNAGWRSAGHSR